MLVLLTLTILSQFNLGDHVYAPPGITVYQTAEDAAIRKNGVERPYDHGKVIALKSVDGEKVVRFERVGFELPAWALSKNLKTWTEEIAKEAVLYKKQAADRAIELTNKKQRIANEFAEFKRLTENTPTNLKLDLLKKYGEDRMTIEEVREAVKKYKDPDGSKELASKIKEKYQKYVKTDKEQAILNLAATKGYDLININSEQRASFTSVQRRLLDSIIARAKKDLMPKD